MKAKFLVPLLAVALLASCSNGGGATGGNGGNGGNGGTAKTGLIADYDLTGVKATWSKETPLDLTGDIKELFVNKVANGAALESATATGKVYKADEKTPIKNGGGIRLGKTNASVALKLAGADVFDTIVLKLQGWEKGGVQAAFTYTVNGAEQTCAVTEDLSTVTITSETDINELTIATNNDTDRFYICGIQLTNN